MSNDTNIPTPRTNAQQRILQYGKTWVEIDFARTLERENIQLRKEFDNFKKKIALQRMFAICEKDGHTTTEDGCAFCLKREIEQFRNTVDAHDYDKVNQQLSAFKKCCEELLKWAKDSPHICTKKDYLEFTEAITRADQLLKGEK